MNQDDYQYLHYSRQPEPEHGGGRWVGKSQIFLIRNKINIKRQPEM